MWSIQEEQNESNTQEEIPIQMKQITKSKLRLIKIGEDSGDESEKSELDLDGYLQTQRLTTNNHAPKKKIKTEAEKQIEKQFNEGYGKGFKIFQNMGFTNVLKGLGKNQQGRTNIVEAQFKTAMTARDQDQVDEKQDECKFQNDKNQKQEEEEQMQRKYDEFKFQELFTYRSKISHVNTLLLKVKNKYETLQAKVGLYSKETDSFNRDLQIAESLKLQKINQIEQINEEINGLQQIQSNTKNINLYPHIAVTYNCDLLILKQSIEKLNNIPLKQLSSKLMDETQNLQKILSNLYFAKQKQSLQGYNNATGFELRFQQYSKQTGMKVNHNFFQSNTSKMKNVGKQQVVEMNFEDAKKIKDFTKVFFEETIMNGKLEIEFKRMKDLSESQDYLIDIMETIKKFCPKLFSQVKDKYLLPLANQYLRTYKSKKNNEEKRLPHQVIFPWLLCIKIQQFDLDGFINRICQKIWSIQTFELLTLMQPWLKFMPTKKCKFFISFYLAPRVLYEMENFDITEQNKGLLKGLKKYCELIPQILKQTMLQNTIAVKIIQVYHAEESKSLKEDLKMWALGWQKQLDKISEGVMKKVFHKHGLIF